MRFRTLLLANVLGLLVLSWALSWAQTGSVMSRPSSFGGMLAADGAFGWLGRAKMQSPSDGVITLLNNAGTDFTRLQLGGTTNSFPALRHSGSTLELVSADNSAFASLTIGGLLTLSSNGIIQGGSLTAANLAAALTTNGMMAYCSDCKITTGTLGSPSTYTNNTCTSGGNGALAIRLNGVNTCYQ